MSRGWWHDLNRFCSLTIHYSNDATRLKQFADKDRVHHFLVGLNQKFGQDEMSSLNEVIAIVSTKESRRRIMLESRSSCSSVLISKSSKSHQQRKELNQAKNLRV